MQNRNPSKWQQLLDGAKKKVRAFSGSSASSADAPPAPRRNQARQGSGNPVAMPAPPSTEVKQVTVMMTPVTTHPVLEPRRKALGLDGAENGGYFEKADMDFKQQEPAIVREFSFENMIAKAERLGMVIQPAINFELDDENERNKKVELPVGAQVYPVCQRGMNRSQLTGQMLKLNHRGLNVNACHGATGGMDFWFMPEHHKAVNHPKQRYWHAFNNLHPEDEKNMPLSPYLPRAAREKLAGQEEIEKICAFPDLDPYNLALVAQIRDCMDQVYFREIINKKGHLICFTAEVNYIMLYRLVDVATRHNTRLDGVVLHPILAKDPLSFGTVQGREQEKEQEVRLFLKKLEACLAIKPALSPNISEAALFHHAPTPVASVSSAAASPASHTPLASTTQSAHS